jgi:hypothetical protein
MELGSDSFSVSSTLHHWHPHQHTVNTNCCALLQLLRDLQDHVVELGKISLDCLIISEMDLGRVCHCLGMFYNTSLLGCCLTAVLHLIILLHHAQWFEGCQCLPLGRHQIDVTMG